uniref:Uncharacterized protein n=1 Tax=Anopheles darlingi TaxID=43151 RepID=A0A2M4DRQ8_ANODA
MFVARYRCGRPWPASPFCALSSAYTTCLPVCTSRDRTGGFTVTERRTERLHIDGGCLASSGTSSGCDQTRPARERIGVRVGCLRETACSAAARPLPAAMFYPSCSRENSFPDLIDVTQRKYVRSRPRSSFYISLFAIPMPARLCSLPPFAFVLDNRTRSVFLEGKDEGPRS